MTKPQLSYSPAFLASLFVVLFTSLSLRAQTEKCGTVAFNNKLGKGEESKAAFEQWMQARLSERHRLPEALRTAANEPLYTIPVVVHVIHKGEAEGVGSNIPYEQILDQIRILNEDFRRQNPDTVNTPDIFKPVAADTRIAFALAQQDPNGFPTNGVVRVEGNRSSYDLNSTATLSELSYWPAEFYMNIWVAPLEAGLLGFANFPVSDLPGLENSPNNPSTDGVVISYRYFGSIGNASSQSAGRTTTHEIGHFLGLRHIWGDGDCSVDDFVDDTPLQGSETNGCPAQKSSCGNENMFQNYLDYTDDACMNIFTQGQKDRMRIVLENSERRTSLLTSPALTAPVLADNDAGISRIVSPAPSECDGAVTPEITIFNAGKQTLASFSVSLFLQGNLVEEVQGNTNLATGESTNVSFTELSLSQGTNTTAVYDLSFAVTRANGSPDENTNNNEKSVNFVIPQQGTLPVVEDFENTGSSTFLSQAIIRNPDEGITWEVIDAPGFGENNQALYLNFYDYENAFGERDALYTPTYDFSNLASATLTFRVAYAPFLDSQTKKVSNDGFRVGISLDCGATLNTLLYDLAGEDLATTPPTDSPFAPKSRADWRTVELSLDDFIGQTNVQLAFVGVNDYGNNVYLDDIRIETREQHDLDLAIARIQPPAMLSSQVQSPALLSCQDQPSPIMVIKNQGRVSIYSFEVHYQVDELAPSSFVYNAFPIEPGEEKEIPLEQLDLGVGLHRLSMRVDKPNLNVDEQPEDNQSIVSFYVDDKRDFIPLIQDFRKASLPDVLAGETPSDKDDWLVVNPDSSTTWEITEAPGNGVGNQAARIRNFVYENVGSYDRLSSPTLDFSNTNTASVFFKVSYALFSENYVDTLRVLVSTDCGQSYTSVYEQSGKDLSVTDTEVEWVPSQASDWIEEFVDLSEFAGQTDVRVVFEAVNGYGNDLYLDDIEFYLSDDREPLSLEENTYRIYPNPTAGPLQVAFNLLEREDATVTLYDIQGGILLEQVLPYTLNQTYTIDLSTQPAGVYILRVNSPSVNTSQRIIVY